MPKFALHTIIAVSLLLASCSGSDKKASVERKLRNCDLLSAGDFNFPIELNEDTRCLLDCVLKGSCEDLEQLICNDNTSAALGQCFEGCGEGPDQDFDCADGSDTIPGSWVCDCEEDCSDGSDEAGCPASACFECDDGSSTLPQHAVCDCFESCADGSDEADCPASACFECADGTWTVPDVWVCDCEDDCDDGSDEASCAASDCFACEDGQWSVPSDYVCDAEPDCDDGSDEPDRCATYTCP